MPALRKTGNSPLILMSLTLKFQRIHLLVKQKKIKVATFSKFFFDTGIVNVILTRKEVAPLSIEYGSQIEQYISGQLRAYISLCEKEHRLEYWRADNRYEVDFVIYEKIEEIFALEVKANIFLST